MSQSDKLLYRSRSPVGGRIGGSVGNFQKYFIAQQQIMYQYRIVSVYINNKYNKYEICIISVYYILILSIYIYIYIIHIYYSKYKSVGVCNVF